jgi:hypothetical protein
MFLARKLMRVAAASAPRRFLAIDSVQHSVSTKSQEPSARVLKLAEVNSPMHFLSPLTVFFLRNSNL